MENLPIDKVIRKRHKALAEKVYTLSELVDVAEEENLPLSAMVVAEAMVKEGKTYEGILSGVMDAFKHNLGALEVGLTRGKSFLLGTVGSDLARYQDRPLIEDSLINRALIYTLATEVGNHEVGLQPCAGTGDSCPYTGLVRALLESRLSRLQVGRLAALMIKIG